MSAAHCLFAWWIWVPNKQFLSSMAQAACAREHAQQRWRRSNTSSLMTGRSLRGVVSSGSSHSTTLTGWLYGDRSLNLAGALCLTQGGDGSPQILSCLVPNCTLLLHKDGVAGWGLQEAALLAQRCVAEACPSQVSCRANAKKGQSC